MKQKRFMSLMVILCMIISMMQLSVSAEDYIAVNVTIAENGKFVAGKDGTNVAYAPVTVTDNNGNGIYDIDDVLFTAHELYYEGGAGQGYKSAYGSYGLSIEKLWGDENGAYSYLINNKLAWSLEDPVENGDSVYAFIYQDKTGWSDIYTYFEDDAVTAAKGQEISLKLNKSGYDAEWNPVAFPVSDATITIDGEITEYKTNSEGEAEISFENTGVYTVSATMEDKIVPPVAIVTVTETETTPPEEDKEEIPDTPQEPEKKDYSVAIPEALEKISTSYKDRTDEWIVMDMGAYENYAPETENKLTDTAKQEYINSAVKTVNESEADTDIDKAVLGLAAIGKNPEILYSVNSNTAFSAIEKLNAIEKSTSAWSAPYTLAAYNQGDYDTEIYETELINALLDNQEESGCWNESGTIDTTANVIAGLSFYKNKENINTAIEHAINYLSTQQNDDGTFSDSYSGSNSNSTAMVVIGLAAAGVDLIQDSRFIKNENNIIDGLLSFMVEDCSGFGHTDNKTVSSGATEQSFRALIAFMQTVKTGGAYNIYDFSKNEFTPAKATGSSASSSSSSSPSGDNISVTMTIKADTGYWLNNYRVTLPGEGATVYHAFVKACSANYITYKGAASGYVSSITKGSKTLAEFDKGKNSGWIYKVNGDVPAVGLTDYEISDGDDIVWYYTEDWTRDPSTRSYSSGSRKTEKTTDDVIKASAKYIYEAINNPGIGVVGGEWAVLGLARSGADIPSGYFDKYYNNVAETLEENQGVLHDKKYTEYSRVVIALTAIGKDPTNVAGYNLISPLLDYDKTVWQGINGAIFALIALDCKDYEKDTDIREKYVQYILNSQNLDGGFSMSGDASDVDTTAMAVTALSNYQNDETVKLSINNALDFISESQLSNGGFTTSESSAQVVVALSTLGISINDKRFVKNEKTVVDNLMSYYIDGKGFRHLPEDDKTDLMATEQAFYALAAFERFNGNKTALYDMSDVKCEVGSDGYAIKKLPVKNKGKTFSDIVNSAEKPKIEALAERGIISGRTDFEFVPDDTMTRAEVAAIIVKSLGLDFAGVNNFTDVTSESWHIDYVRTAYYYGIVKGLSAEKFSPETSITKEEAAVMIRRAAKICGITDAYDADSIRDILDGFVDYTGVNDWAGESLAFCYDNDILSDEDIEILPNHEVTRAEVAAMIYNMLEKSKLL